MADTETLIAELIENYNEYLQTLTNEELKILKEEGSYILIKDQH